MLTENYFYSLSRSAQNIEKIFQIAELLELHAKYHFSKNIKYILKIQTEDFSVLSSGGSKARNMRPSLSVSGPMYFPGVVISGTRSLLGVGMSRVVCRGVGMSGWVGMAKGWVCLFGKHFVPVLLCLTLPLSNPGSATVNRNPFS